MKIQQYLRARINKILHTAMIKSTCIVCGGKENLEIHHEDMFSQLFQDCLKITKIKYREDSREYSNEEREIIFLVLLGLHCKSEYKILCSSCHSAKHSKEELDRIKFLKVRQRKLFEYLEEEKYLVKNDLDILTEYNMYFLNKEMSNKIGKPLTKNEWDTFRNHINKNIRLPNLRRNNKSIGIVKLNSILNDYNIPYKVKRIAKRASNNTRWIVFKLGVDIEQ